MKTLYFHGLPGSAAELQGFGAAVANATKDWAVVPRDVDPGAHDYFGVLAARIASTHPEGPLRLVAFSLGAAAALRVSLALGERVRQIDLIAPAAPLQLGDFLSGMAGAPVFRAALAGRAVFGFLTLVQAQVARMAAQGMAGALMAKAKGADAELGRDPIFIDSLTASLRHSLLHARAAYAREIKLYVADWRSELARVRQPVAIWQGLADDWVPPAMTQALAHALPDCRRIEWRDGLSHFSTLRAYLQEEAECFP